MGSGAPPRHSHNAKVFKNFYMWTVHEGWYCDEKSPPSILNRHAYANSVIDWLFGTECSDTDVIPMLDTCLPRANALSRWHAYRLRHATW